MNRNIERKLNEVFTAVGNISERIDKLDEKLENFDRRITKLVYLVEEKISKFQQELKIKADDSALNKLHLKMRKIKQQQVDQLTKDVMQESYEKWFNILINGIEETNTSVWEKRETTLQLVQDFIKRGLQIKDPSAIMLANYYCLPFQLECKALLPSFKEAKALKKKTSWRAENGHYCLYIDNVKVSAENDYHCWIFAYFIYNMLIYNYVSFMSKTTTLQ